MPSRDTLVLFIASVFLQMRNCTLQDPKMAVYVFGKPTWARITAFGNVYKAALKRTGRALMSWVNLNEFKLSFNKFNINKAPVEVYQKI